MKGESFENDELVKHMTHLPDYLHQMERKETLQEKALNVGVLDWSRLENFTQKSKASIVVNPSGIANLHTTAGNCYEKASNTNKLSSRKYQGITQSKGRHHCSAYEMDTSLFDFKHSRDEDDSMTSSAYVMHHEKIDLSKEEVTSLPKIREKLDLQSMREEGMAEYDRITTRSVNCLASNHNTVKLHCFTKQSNIDIFPKMRRDKYSLESSQQRDRMKMSSGYLTEPHWNCLSDSYPKDPMGEFKTMDKIPKFRDDTSQVGRLGKDLPEGGISEMNALDGSHVISEDSSKGERFQTVDREFGDLPAQRGLPNQKFNLNGLSRSFSFKETTSSSTLISSGSEPRTADDLILAKDKPNLYTKLRFGSLRRLFDSILKYQPVTANSCIEDVQFHLNSSIRSSILCDESVPLKRQRLTIKALLQLTVVKGSPLLKFMVDNDRQVLVCSTKELTSLGNREKRFTFYSLDETKEKSGSWISQGCKTNIGNFACSEVGHMCATQSGNSGKKTLDREHVLFSSETGISRKENKNCNSVARVEVAAIVSKVHACGKNRHRNKYADLEEGILPSKKCYSKGHDTTTVILPGAIHSLPFNGGPSSLITRWRSGGSCDCGGWDVGCKLNVLANNKIPGQMLTTTDSYSTSMCLELFQQEESDSNEPVFCLKPDRKGIFSVQFSSLLSSLQAFAICTAFISSRVSSKPLDSSHFPGERDSVQLSSGQKSEIKHPTVSKVKEPGKYSQPKHLTLTPLDQ
ncbi:hypothetical protein MLD38_023891 [Melastoma candidum]|nr:hypothetical protein MLD38_023891 [Melastoma candidum]